MINRITELRQMVGARYLVPVGTGYFVAVVIDIDDRFESAYGKVLAEIVDYDSALKLDSLTIEEMEACLQEVKAQNGSTWVVLDTLKGLSDG